MSWFTEIAGKAEDFLNKIDQNAAIVINQATTSDGKTRRKSPSSPAPSTPRLNDLESSIETSNGYQSESSSRNASEFLSNIENNGHAQDIKNGNLSPSMPRSSVETEYTGNSEGNNISSSKTKNNKKSTPVIKKSSSPNKSKTATSNVSSSPISKTESAKKKEEEEDLIAFLNDSSKKHVDEKFVLQNELANQAREVELLFKNNKQIQAENEMLKAQIARHEEGKSKEVQISEMEGQILQSELAQRNLKSHLKEKDSEITKLKKSLDQTLEKLQQLEALQTVQNKLEVVEMEKQKTLQANEELQDKIQSLSNQLQASETHVSSVKSSLSLLETEFLSYKEKAKSILKQKDDLITSIQNPQASAFGGGEGESTLDFDNPLLSEVNALRSERELLHAEISQCRATTDSLREESHRLESEVSMMRSMTSQLQQQIKSEKESSSALQDENLQMRQQLSSLQFELDVEQSEKRKLIEDKSRRENNEEQQRENNLPISGRTSPMTPAMSQQRYNGYSGSQPDTEENLRMRITALSQSLLEKQTLINNISSDKQLLQIHVERLQDEMRQNGSSDGSSNYTALTQTVISNKPLYLSESPWDSGMSTSVKRAFSSVDTLCCQAGLALRRRPNLRLGFCIYILCLHFWVFFILFHSFSHVPNLNSSSGGGPAPM